MGKPAFAGRDATPQPEPTIISRVGRNIPEMPRWNSPLRGCVPPYAEIASFSLR